MIKLLHEIRSDNKPKRMTFAVYIIDWIENDKILIFLSNEANFHVLGL